jgi:hypothetical protein
MSVFRILAAAGVAPLLLAAQAPTSQAAPTAKPAGANTVDPGKVICRKFPPPVGSRIGPRNICKTKAEWDYIDQQQEEVIDAVQKKPFQVTN